MAQQVKRQRSATVSIWLPQINEQKQRFAVEKEQKEAALKLALESLKASGKQSVQRRFEAEFVAINEEHAKNKQALVSCRNFPRTCSLFAMQEVQIKLTEEKIKQFQQTA